MKWQTLAACGFLSAAIMTRIIGIEGYTKFEIATACKLWIVIAILLGIWGEIAKRTMT